MVRYPAVPSAFTAPVVRYHSLCWGLPCHSRATGPLGIAPGFTVTPARSAALVEQIRHRSVVGQFETDPLPIVLRCCNSCRRTLNLLS